MPLNRLYKIMHLHEVASFILAYKNLVQRYLTEQSKSLKGVSLASLPRKICF